MRNLTNITIFLVFILSYSCAAPVVKEEMLADGKTWRVKAGSSGVVKGCAGVLSSSSECISRLRPVVENRANSLCGKPPKSIRACSRVQGSNVIECLVQCD